MKEYFIQLIQLFEEHQLIESTELDTKTLDVLKDRSIARDKLLDDLIEKGQSIDIENYDLINILL